MSFVLRYRTTCASAALQELEKLSEYQLMDRSLVVLNLRQRSLFDLMVGIVVSPLPFAAMGLMVSIALKAVILWIGSFPILGSMWSSRERKVSKACLAETLPFFTSSHWSAMCC